MQFNNYKRGLQTLLLLGMALMLGGCATMQDLVGSDMAEDAGRTIRFKVHHKADAATWHDRYSSSNFMKRRNIPDKETFVRNYDVYAIGYSTMMRGLATILFLPKDKAPLEPGDILDIVSPPPPSPGSTNFSAVMTDYRLVCKHTDEACLEDPERGRKRGFLD